jgi:hypothetical protein
MAGKPWTEEEKRILRQEWLRGTVSKLITDKLPGRTEKAIRKFAIDGMGLPKRRVRSKEDNRHNRFTVYVDSVTKRAVGRRAFERGQPESDYLRMLIKRDLGHET